MPNCDFYALSSDLVEVLDFVFAQPGWQLVELASRHDQPLRTFHTTRALVDVRGRAKGKRGSRPVLPAAWEAVERGDLELALTHF